MRHAVFAVLLAAGLAGRAAATDLESMQGNWKRILAIHDGKPLVGATLDSRVTIEGNKYTVTGGADAGSTGTLQLNESEHPKSIDLAMEGGSTQAGIYEVRAGNRYRLCFAAPGAPRPARFESRPGSGYRLEEWERVK
jgi:uncharacterized protein (TIGR03067 family)